MRHALRTAERFAASSAPILITGESGTGKEVISRRIHQCSSRSNRPYIRVNCAALSESLFESELFGHEAGSFTGATSRRVGRFELASGGTLLLDEISEIPTRLQAKLLRVLEEGEFERVGASQSQFTDVRVLATSNRKLETEVQEGRFRADLYYRLSVLEIPIRPLRERRDDILPLVRFFLDRFANESPHPNLELTAAASQQLLNFDWPGNVRQLRNVSHQLCILSPSPAIRSEDLPLSLETPASERGSSSLYDLPLREVERLVIETCLDRFQGNKTAAARHLGVTARTLHNKLRQYDDAA